MASDTGMLDLLRRNGPMSVSELVQDQQVTETAVRQRLNRLMGEGLIERQSRRQTRGRPSHQYSVTEKAVRQAGSNSDDLAVILWEEIRSIEDPEVKRGLLQRLARRMAHLYGDTIPAADPKRKMERVRDILDERSVSFQVNDHDSLPVLEAVDCPYPQLAEKDRSVCTMEKMMLSELLDENMRLSTCRLDGDPCCRFEMQAD